MLREGKWRRIEGIRIFILEMNFDTVHGRALGMKEDGSFVVISTLAPWPYFSIFQDGVAEH